MVRHGLIVGKCVGVTHGGFESAGGKRRGQAHSRKENKRQSGQQECLVGSLCEKRRRKAFSCNQSYGRCRDGGANCDVEETDERQQRTEESLK